MQTSRPYAPVMPLPALRPFWQRADIELPYFMRAHQLELGGDWAALLALTDDWAEHERRSAEPWVFRGRGLAHTADFPGARSAFEHALQLDPMSSNAWLERMASAEEKFSDAEQLLFMSDHLSNVPQS